MVFQALTWVYQIMPLFFALLCVAGAATLASVGWGMKDAGLYCVAVMLLALVAARQLANDSASGPAPVLSVSRNSGVKGD